MGLGAIGLQLARALDAGVPGLRLAAVAVRDRDCAVAAMRGFRDRPLVLGPTCRGRSSTVRLMP